MIVAAAAHAEDSEGAPPPRELVLYWQTQQYHALPESGGLLDQPGGLLARLTAAGNAYNVFKGWLEASSKLEWSTLYPAGRRLVDEIYKLRKNAKRH
jgi:hypothetical protein